jgi:hypothetical protein
VYYPRCGLITTFGIIEFRRPASVTDLLFRMHPMSRNWLRNLANIIGGPKNRRTRRVVARRLGVEALETRVVPSTSVTFQQGAVPNGDVNPYAGTTEVRIDSSAPTVNVIPNSTTNTNGFYFLDGTNAGDLTSPNQWDLIRFDGIFGNGPGQIPVGSVIRSATLSYSTGTSSGTPTDSGSSPTGGPFGVSPLLTPFTSTTTWDSFGGEAGNPDYGRAGPLMDIQTAAPVSTFHNATALSGYAMTASSTPTPTAADVTQTVQQWDLNPNSNLGFNIRQLNSNDGWGVRTIGNATIANRPSLTIAYDPPPAPLQVTTFQQGVNGYAGTVNVWLQANNTSTDGNTIINPSFLDGNTPSDPTSPDDQMLIKFTGLFGSGPGQIPVGSTIQSAKLVMTTGGLLDSGSANSNGAWAASQVLQDWPATTHYQDALWGGNGPTDPTSRTAAVATPGASTSELSVLSNVTASAWDQKSTFDVTTAVQNWATGASPNDGMDLQASGTSDGWQIYFSGATDVQARPQLVVYYTAPAATEPATNTVDLSNGVLSYNGGAGLANNLTVSQVEGGYALTDSSGPITLTAAAQTAGWIGSGTTTVTGPTNSVTQLAIETGTGVDTVTLAGGSTAITVDGGGQVGDTVNIVGAIATAGADFSVIGADTITAAPGSLLNTGTGTVNLTATTNIGTSAAPILTQAGRLNLTAGSGGAFATEADGAALVANVTNGGALAVTSTTGPLMVNGGEFARTDGGPITLSSGDDVVINGFVGDSAATGAGLITINANTDGASTNGYSQGARAGLSTSGDVTINVNTVDGGTGNATLALGGIGGTLTVNANGGSILWNAGLTIPADSATTNVAALSARNFVLSTTGLAGAIGTAASPIQTNMIGTADNTSGNSTVNLQAGSGGIFLTAWGPLDPTVTNATATKGGNIVIVSANAGTHELYVTGPVTTESGNINLRADDDLILNAGALIGGPGFVGTVTLQANQDGANEQRLHMDPAASIVTQNTTAGAVALSVKATDTNVANATIGGIDLANITVGDGGTITVDAAPGTGNQQGNITQAPGTVLNAGPDGKVVLNARSLLNAGAPAVGAGIGTVAAPILTQAGTVAITATNSPTAVTEADGASFAATLTGPGDLNLTSTSGILTISGPTNTDGGAINLTDTGTGGGIAINSALGDSNSGAINLNSGSNNIAFNSAFTVNVGQTATLTSNNPVILGVTTTNNGTIVAPNGVTVGAGDTVTGAGSVSGPLVVAANGSFNPAGSNPTIYNTGNLQIAPGGILNLTTAGVNPGTDYDQINVTGTVNVTGGLLRLNVGAGIAVGNSFTIINNDGTDPVVGQFVGGTTIRAFNNPLVTFTINYAGGDGNDVVATVSDINPASALVDVSGGTVTYFSNVNINNNVTLTRSAGVFSLTEAAGNITLSSAAITAGWTGNNTHTVTAPTAGITGLVMGLSDGTDTISGIDAGTASVSLNGSGSLTIAGPITTASTFGFDEFTSVAINAPVAAGTGINITGQTPLTLSGNGTLSTTAGDLDLTRFSDSTVGGVTLNAPAGTVNVSAGGGTLTLNTLTDNSPTLALTGSGTVNVAGTVTASGTVTTTGIADLTAATGSLIVAPSVNFSASDGVGTATNPEFTQTGSISAAGGPSGVNITEADGATVTATATGTGNVTLTSLAGPLTVSGPVTTAAGNITLSSGDDVIVNAPVGGTGTSGTITIAANTDGAGSQGYTQSLTGNLQTTNTTGGAATITVNSPTGGTGNAVLGTGSIGGNAGGTITVNSNNGSILWNSGFGTVSGGTLPNPVGGSDSQTLNARNYSFTSTLGSIGTADTPIQTNNFASADTTASNSIATLAAGTGGIYLTDWGSLDLTVGSAVAAGGDIQLVSGNASGHNLFVTGPVYTGAGNIFIAADDDLRLPGAQIGGTGAQGPFAGTVTLFANRDNGNEQRIVMDGTASIITTNTSATAVQMFVNATDNDPSNATLGGVTLGTVTVGDGGTITVVGANGPTFQGNIIQILGTRLDAGSTGHIVLQTNNLTGAGGAPAAGAGIRFDLDGTGVNTGPLQVRAGDVSVIAVNTPVSVAEGDGSFFNDADGLGVSAILSGPGALNFSTSSGPVTVDGPTNTDGGAITLSSTGANGGIIVNAPLGDANTGSVLLDAGTNDVVINSTLLVPAGTTTTINDGNHAQLGTSTVVSAGATLTAANGLDVGSGDVLSGAGTVNAPTFVLPGGAVSPGISGLGTLSTGSLTLGANSVLTADLNGTGLGQADQVIANGTIDVTGAVLRLNVNAPLAVGNSFTIISNTGGLPIIGQFASGTTVTAFNDPRYQFTINYAGGSGHDIVATVSNILPTVLDISNGQVQYSSGAGINNNLTVGLAGGTYTLTDSGTTIGLAPAAIAAGWTGSGTHTVSGPAAGVVGIAALLGDGTDTVSGLTTGVSTTVSAFGSLQILNGMSVTGDLTIAGPATLTAGGAITASNSISVTGAGDIDQAAGGTFASPTVNFTASDVIGAAAANIETQATTVTAAAGSGGVFITEADGASFAATATGTGNIALATNSGTLAIGGPTATAAGNITLSSPDGIAVNAPLGGAGTSGTITIAANTDGVGAQGYTQSPAGNLQTTNGTTGAVAITVNTASGGTGDAVLGTGSVGGNSGGTITVAANAGTILWGLPLDIIGVNNPAGGGNVQTLHARDYVLTAGGSIGTAAAPIQTDNYSSADGPAAGTTAPAGQTSANLTAGAGGIYLSDWGGLDFVLSSATATGAGNIQVVAGNAGGHNMFVTGPVHTDTGNIFLAADDDLYLGAGVVVGGTTYSGTITLAGSRDTVNEQQVIMDPTASVVTTNATANAVLITDTATDTAPSDATIGGIILSNVTVGNGGTITVNAALTSANQGRIIQVPGTQLNAGANGTVILDAISALNGTAPAVGAGIGTAAQPIAVTAANVSIASVNSPVFVTDAIGAWFTAGVTGPGSLNLTTSIGVLSVVGPVNTDGGAINLTATGAGGGVAFNAPLGDSNSGPITIAGPITGTGSIVLGTSGLTINQSTTTTFAGHISGPQGIALQGGGTLILTNTSSYTGPTTVNAGSTLIVNGALTGTSGETVAAGATLGGTGSVAGPTVVAGTLAPGAANPGAVTTGNLSFAPGGAVAVKLNGTTAGSGFDQIDVNGTVNLNGAALTVTPGFTAPAGSQYTIINNDGSDPVTGTFASGSTITATDGQVFTINYAGGDGNDVVLTKVTAAPVTVASVQVNDGNAQRSEVRSIAVTFSGPVTFAGGNVAAAFQLLHLTDSSNVTLGATVSVDGQGRTVVTLTFSGAETDSISTQHGGIASLADGLYQLTILSAAVTGANGLTLNGGGPGGNYVSPADTQGGGAGQLGLFRLFGDVTGNGIVDQLDLGQFRSANNSVAGSAAYIAFLDADNSGTIDQLDLGQFRARNNSSVF